MIKANQNRAYLPLKVVHFIWWIPHYRVPIFRLLSQNSHLEFTVCAGDNNERPGGYRVVSANDVGNIEGVNWRHIESRRIKGSLFKDFEWQPDAVKIAWKENIDVVITLGYQSLSNFLVRIICRLRGIPVIEWTHGVKRPEHGIRWLVRKLYFKFANAFLIYGEFARDFFISRGFKKEQIFVVHNSLGHGQQVAVREKIRPDQIEQCRRDFGITSPDHRLIFNSSRLEKGKQLHLLIEALALLKQRGRYVQCILIGDGREEDSLKRLTQERGVADRVVFYGACYDEEKLGLIILSSDLCVVPGEVGLVAMHSLVYGTPLLTCENTRGMHGPEIETIKNGKTGSYFKDGDYKSLAEKMEEMLYPVPCRERMSEACKHIIDTQYTPEYQERVVIEAINYVLPREKRIPIPD
jgi:glycosyltransferase involved in cell wall biosynthesis